jgi:hypothetical protein
MIGNQISECVQNTFNKKRIIALLFFGSRAFGFDVHPKSDYDFLLVLDKYYPLDIFKLRKITTKKTNLEAEVTVNFLYLDDINKRGKMNFQLRSVLGDFYTYLGEAKTLLGNNIFKENPISFEEVQITKLLDFKIQEYYGRCDKLLLQNPANKVVYSQLQKYTREMIRGLLIRQKYIEIRDISKLSYVKMFQIAAEHKLFSSEIIENFQGLLDFKFSPLKLRKLEKVRRIVYEKYLDLYSS